MVCWKYSWLESLVIVFFLLLQLIYYIKSFNSVIITSIEVLMILTFQKRCSIMKRWGLIILSTFSILMKQNFIYFLWAQVFMCTKLSIFRVVHYGSIRKKGIFELIKTLSNFLAWVILIKFLQKTTISAWQRSDEWFTRDE